MRCLAAILISVAACKSGVEWADYKQVCSGKPLAGAAAYTGGTSPIIAFEKHFDDWRKPYKAVPDAWTSWKDVAKYQLVACVDGTEKTQYQACTYDGGHSLNMYDATYKVSIVEAKTGKVLTTATWPMKNPQRECLLVRSFDNTAEGDYPDFRGELEKLAKPFVVH